MKQPIRICHISDFHLPLMDEAGNRIGLQNLLNQRILGWANLKFNRSKNHSLEAFEALIDQMSTEQYDLALVTGDVTNLALGAEFDFADRMLRRAGLTPDKTIVIPGNHDRYTFGSDITHVFERKMAAWLPEGFLRNIDYPIIKKMGPIMVAAIDTAVWRGPLKCSGKADPNQLQRLKRQLDEDLWPVIVMHHPPFELTGSFQRNFWRGFEDYHLLFETMAGRKATFIHGHMHKLSRRQIDDKDIIGITSASNLKKGDKYRLAYHIYTFDESGLIKAEAVRYYPEEKSSSKFKRKQLPQEAIVN